MAEVFTSGTCLEHNPGVPEQPARLRAVQRLIESDGRFEMVESAPANSEALLLRHPREYVDALPDIAAANDLAGQEVLLNPGSWEAILAATGAVLAATEQALDGRHAFAAVRPPGHHASATTAMGYCPVNLVAIAASWARQRGVDKVLIVDWDVHHGNGTQDLVWNEPETRFVSMHQSPWYPGTGLAEERGVGNVFNVPLPPGLQREDYVEQLWTGITAATSGWQPELMLISAGYDGMAGDPLGGFTLEPDDYATWVGRIRERWPELPIAALMEGGYAPGRLAQGVLSTVAALAG